MQFIVILVNKRDHIMWQKLTGGQVTEPESCKNDQLQIYFEAKVHVWR